MGMPARGQSKARLAKKVRIGQLLELYGILLTDRQREFVRLHHDEDMSFGEIAREYDVSRQAVHDAVRHAEAAMEHYEAGLELLKKPGRPAKGGARESEKPRGVAAADQLEPIAEDLEALRRRLAGQGIIYDPEEHVRVLDDIIERLRSVPAGEGG
jgi:predicted DNA-binding protein YlxM (UPF0122 family)